ncbi:MAG: asparaginase [Bacteroidetes bacterium]|nr:asparaginase [Bacteroidota bacterium]
MKNKPAKKIKGKQKRILILYTGGTIGMMHDHRTHALKPLDFSSITDLIPELNHLNCKIDFHSSRKPIDSSNVQPALWVELAELIEKKNRMYDGFVILHGTDTMAYTASALSYLLGNLSKPVILTGSQLPLGVIRTDAKRNLITTVEIAASKIIVPEVCIYFNNQLFRGNRSEKFTSSKFDAFQSPNYPVLAEAGTEIRFNKEVIRNPGKVKLQTGKKNFDTNVALIRIYPGLSKEAVTSVLSTKRLRAVILETYGSGNAPTDSWFVQTLDRAIKNDVIILNVSQCSGGIVEQGKYETSLQLKKIGVISGRDITREAALTKLMFLLGQGMKKREMEKLLNEDLRGEMSAG